MINRFDGYFSVVIFALLSIFYLIQIYLACTKGMVLRDAIRPNSTNGKTNLFLALKTFDGGLSNSIWAFLILGIFLPVMLASMSNVVPILHGRLIPPQSPVTPLSASPFYIYISLIMILITLEFSYIHNLRKEASEWITFLLVALVLDLITLLILIFVLTPPIEWKTKISSITQFMMAFTALCSLLSTFLVLVLARVAGALNEKTIDFPEIDKASHVSRSVIRRKRPDADDQSVKREQD